MNDLVDTVFRLDSAAPIVFRRGGALREVVLWGFASMIMYFREREAAGEARRVNLAMMDALRRCKILNDMEPSAVYYQWGALIEESFSLANLHLTQRATDTDSNQVHVARALTTHTPNM